MRLITKLISYLEKLSSTNTSETGRPSIVGQAPDLSVDDQAVRRHLFELLTRRQDGPTVREIIKIGESLDEEGGAERVERIFRAVRLNKLAEYWEDVGAWGEHRKAVRREQDEQRRRNEQEQAQRIEREKAEARAKATQPVDWFALTSEQREMQRFRESPPSPSEFSRCSNCKKITRHRTTRDGDAWGGSWYTTCLECGAGDHGHY